MKFRRTLLALSSSLLLPGLGCGGMPESEEGAPGDDDVEQAADALGVVATVSHSAVALYSSGLPNSAFAIRGTGFGVPKLGSNVRFKLGGATTWTQIASTNAQVKVWTDNLIIVYTDKFSAFKTGQIAVRTNAGGIGPAVSLEIYKMDSFNIAAGAGFNVPIAAALDGAGRVWINEEFNLHSMAKWDPATQASTRIEVPYPAGPGPFALVSPYKPYADTRSQTSALGEDIMVDPMGRVWLALGGTYLYSGTNPNHSRIVNYNPATGAFRIYNVPGDQNEVFGLAWDATRNRVWFTSNATQGKPAKLTSFDPERIPYDNTFDFSTSLAHQVCAPGAPDAACYHEYPLPSINYIVPHVAIDAAGHAWYTTFWGMGNPATGKNQLGRVNPATGAVTAFPLATPAVTAGPGIYAGSGAWTIKFASNGDALFCEQFDITVSRFSISRLNDPACLSLVNGQNPCIRETVIPDTDNTSQLLHSIALDAQGNTWFTNGDYKSASGSPAVYGRATVGYITPANKVVQLPPIGLFPNNPQFTGTGLAISKTNGEIWFTNFFGRKLNRLRKVN